MQHVCRFQWRGCTEFLHVYFCEQSTTGIVLRSPAPLCSPLKSYWQPHWQCLPPPSRPAYVKLFICASTNVRLCLLHYRYYQPSLSIQDGKKQLKLLSSDEIPEEPTRQDFELGWFEEGRHELELVVQQHGRYYLQDIQIDFWTE